MGQQQRNRRPTLEPVLENYMGSPVSYSDAPRNPRHGGSAKVAPSTGGVGVAKQSGSKNPFSVFGKLRDRYIKRMNEMAMGGDFAAVAGYHGCVSGNDYPGSVEHQMRERELDALREEVAAFRRLQSAQS